MNTIKMVIADDEKLIRTGLKMMLETFDELEVVALAENGQQAYEACQQHAVDLVLMDIRMPHTNGIEGTRLIKQHFPQVKVLILTTFQDEAYITEAMHLGASGYLLKDSTHEAIFEGIKLALADKIVMDASVSHQLLKPAPAEKKPIPVDLTEKERQLIELVASGYNNREIAQTLFLSEGTVKNNVSQLLFKLDLRDRTQLVIFAYENGLK
ncbi:MAG: response regulator transcription factor [Aerococcaceae bacterium]|nr:response regulator transcription factor [Aerococcaceae bacterium]